MISTKTIGTCGVLKIQLEMSHVLIAAVRCLETGITNRTDETARNRPAVSQTGWEIKDLSVLGCTSAHTVQVATCTPGCLIAGIILLGTQDPFVYTMCSETPCAINFFLNSRQHVSNPPVLKSLQLILYHVYIRNANFI